MGVTADDLRMLDAATLRAKENIDAMNATLDVSLERAERFFAEIESIRKAA